MYLIFISNRSLPFCEQPARSAKYNNLALCLFACVYRVQLFQTRMMWVPFCTVYKYRHTRKHANIHSCMHVFIIYDCIRACVRSHITLHISDCSTTAFCAFALFHSLRTLIHTHFTNRTWLYQRSLSHRPILLFSFSFSFFSSK